MCDCISANFTAAILSGANFTNSVLNSANFDDANLTNTVIDVALPVRGTFLRQFGKEGDSLQAEFKRPAGIAVRETQEGTAEIFVVDSDNKRMQVFSTDGRLIRSFRLTLDGEQGRPVCVA